MDHDGLRLMSSLSELIGRGVYAGRYLDSDIRAARAAADVLIDSSAATADVTVDMYKGGMSFSGMSARGAGQLPPRQTRFTAGGQHWQIVAV
jgi:argininosuccinate synthase